VDPAEALENGLTGSEAAYGPNIIAAVEVILGTYGAQGKLPLDIPVYDEESNSYLNEISYARGYGLTYDTKKEIFGTFFCAPHIDACHDACRMRS
jgi:beta-N-acetylhexosaminidase